MKIRAMGFRDYGLLPARQGATRPTARRAVLGTLCWRPSCALAATDEALGTTNLESQDSTGTLPVRVPCLLVIDSSCSMHGKNLVWHCLS